jgi:hypothetical protein
MFIQTFSQFVSETDSTAKPLSSLMSAFSGTHLFTHIISDYPLPTWAHLTVVEKTLDKDASERSLKDFAAAIKFQHHADNGSPSSSTAAPAGTKIPEIATSVLDPRYHLAPTVGTNPARNAPPTAIPFRTNESSLPDVFYFDPYAYQPSKLSYTVITGIKIETLNLDGFTIPLPHLGTSLYANNSQALQSAVPLGKIWNPFSSATTPVVSYARPTQDSDIQLVSAALYDMSLNLLPQFDSLVTGNQPNELYGFNRTGPTTDYSLAFSKFGYAIDTAPPIPDETIICWSSYRYVRSRRPALASDVFMVLSLRNIFGTNVTLARSRHPANLIPS